jgi:hypothetical protein
MDEAFSCTCEISMMRIFKCSVCLAETNLQCFIFLLKLTLKCSRLCVIYGFIKGLYSFNRVTSNAS